MQSFKRTKHLKNKKQIYIMYSSTVKKSFYTRW